MSKYKISVTIDGDNFFWVVVDREMFIKNPTKEDIKGAKYISYSKTNICPRCKEENNKEGKELTDRSILYTKNACREKDKYGNETGEFVCNRHWIRNWDKHTHGIVSGRRTGNLDQNSDAAKGDNFQELTKIWRSTISVVPVEDLNKKFDNYKSPIDHSFDSELGVLQTKGAFYSPTYKYWHNSFKNEHNAIRRGFKFDNLIFYCASEDGLIIERIYIFPKGEVEKRTSVSICNNDNYHWYVEYSIDEDELEKVNEIWNEIIKNKG